MDVFTVVGMSWSGVSVSAGLRAAVVSAVEHLIDHLRPHRSARSIMRRQRKLNQPESV